MVGEGDRFLYRLGHAEPEKITKDEVREVVERCGLTCVLDFSDPDGGHPDAWLNVSLIEALTPGAGWNDYGTATMAGGSPVISLGPDDFDRVRSLLG